MTTNRLKITVIGGGSVLWSPTLLRDIVLTPELGNADIVLYDIDRPAAEASGAFLSKLAKQVGANATFTPTDDPAAMAGSGYVIIIVSTGGLDAMGQDLAISEEFGIYHTVGDTAGPAGWSRLIRNFDAFVNIAGHIERYAPGAFVLNYTNPMSMLTDVLSRLCTGPVIGLCHSLFENLELLQRLHKLDRVDRIIHRTAGLNHFYWTTEAVTDAGVDILGDLRKRVEKQSLTAIFSEGHEDLAGFSSQREVATDLFRLTGCLPYMGDRHTCEFMAAYITSLERMKEFKLVRTTIADRKNRFAKHKARLQTLIEGPIDPVYTRKTSETAAEIIAAHSQGKTFIDVGNVPNLGQIDNLPRGLVVETMVRVDRLGVTPLAFGTLPAVVHGLIEPYGYAYPMTVEACFRGDKRMAVEALRIDPVCAALTSKQVQDLADKLLGAHQRFITAFDPRKSQQARL